MDDLIFGASVAFLILIIFYKIKARFRAMEEVKTAYSEADYFRPMKTPAARTRRPSRLYIIGVFALVSGVFGSFIGIAGFGDAISGTIPCAILGAIIGHLVMNQRKKTV